MQKQPRKTRRTPNACIACRQSKIKCSGSEPCVNCQRREIRCEFMEGVSKILVSERYLRQLEAHAQGPPGASVMTTSDVPPLDSPLTASDQRPNEACVITPDTSRISTGGLSPPLGTSQSQSHARDIWTSPFTLPSTTIRNTKENRRSWIWLAPSSMWSFTTRLTILMTEKLHHEYPFNAPTLVEKEIYPLRWDVDPARKDPGISGLPSLDYSLYLFETVKFHLGQAYRLLDEDQFVKRLRAFYHGNPTLMAAECRLWFIQFLLVISFGTAFLCRSRSDQPAGSAFFVRAMSLMPDHASLWKDSLLAIEVLAMAALYLYSIDQRESAHIYLGQAIRIAQFEGLHTRLPEEQLGTETVARCRDLWWTLYIMDRHFSYSVGLPMTTTDSEISALIDPPNRCEQRNVALSLQARLSQLMSFILTTVYKTERTRLDVFLDTTRSILQTLAGYAQEVEDIIHLRFRNSVDTMPKGTRHITLLYHQCVIVATRPLLLSALIERLDNLESESEDWRGFLALTKTLISTGIKSAAKTLQILSGSESLLEVFLVYDLEFAYAAAIHLAMANAVFPQLDDVRSFSQEAHSILDGMISNGNRIAEARKEELIHLEGLFHELARRAESQGLQPLTLTTPDDLEAITRHSNEDETPRARPEEERAPLTDSALMSLSTTGYPHSLCPTDMEMQSVDLLANIGISSAEFLSIVDQIGDPDASYSLLDPETGDAGT